ncbi:alpha-amylase family glycosyl hydrolase [Salana multivorans]
MSEWWRDAVFYQVYPRSFADADGDGEGDLAGLERRLGAIAALGVDALWLTPFYPSPMVDGGYDVADYTDVDPRYGDLAAFDRLLAAAHAAGLRVTIDLVPNHCSSEHEWFRAAVGAAPGSSERARFLVRDGRGPNGSEPPTNWGSVFSGASWTQLPDGQWYYHLFDPTQPDFNWDNPDVPEEFERILRFWLDRGVDGFRIDVSDALVKDFAAGDTHDGNPVIPKGADSPLHEHYRRFRRVMDTYDGDRMAVLETGAPAEDVALLVRRDEMHLAFDLALTKARWSADALRHAVEEGLAVSRLSGAPPTWVIENHDLPRAVTRYGADVELAGEYVPETEHERPVVDVARGTRRARAAAVLLLALPGAVYLYQGQELGLPEVEDLPDEARQDPVFHRSGGASRGRDGCRVPLPWEGETAPYGFGPAGSSPWLPQPEIFAELTRERQERDPESMLALYRELLAVRRAHAVLREGEAGLAGRLPRVGARLPVDPRRRWR